MTADFNWMEEYGPHWEPGSTAFWLEPRKADDLKAWLGKYRPDFHGEMTIGFVTVTIPRKRDYLLTDKSKWPAAMSPVWSPYAQAPLSQAMQNALQQQTGLGQSLGRQQSMLGIGTLGLGRIFW